MLCEGSPLLLYTPWGPVTPTGIYHSIKAFAGRVCARWAARRAARRGFPIASGLDNEHQCRAQLWYLIWAMMGHRMCNVT